MQISTAGNDIKQPTGGIGYNLVLKRGTNQFKGSANGYFTNHKLEAANVPAPLAARGVTADTANHNKQISDMNVDLGGPIAKNKAWFYGAYATQDVRVFRASGQYIDRTWFEQHTLKGEWQATKKDMVSVLYYKGDTDKVGRSPADSGILIDAPDATWESPDPGSSDETAQEGAGGIAAPVEPRTTELRQGPARTTLSLEDIRLVKDLVRRIGPDRLRDVIDLFQK